MRNHSALALALALLPAAPAAGSAPSCALPAFSVRELKVGDGSLDRGFPGGISLVDFDGDGDLDVMATRGYDSTQTARPLRYDRSMLYANDGKGQFSHHADSPIANADDPTSGSTWADIDGDGDSDAFVSTQHGRPDRFYRNLGGGRLAREDLGEATATKGSNFTSSWADIDGDGDLDLISGGATLEPGQPNLVFRNDQGTFRRVTGTAIENGISNPGALLWADFDNDGDQDLFVANSDLARVSKIAPAEREASTLYRNEGGWNFTPAQPQDFAAAAYPAHSAAAGDIDNDGDLDLFVALQPGSAERPLSDRIFLNRGDGTFVLDSRFTGPPHSDIAAGAAFADFDLDGDLDLLFADYGSPPYLYLNDGTGAFTPSVQPEFAERATTHAGLATGDLDGDGDADAVIGNWGESSTGEFALVMTNPASTCARAYAFELRDRNGAIDPPGARVTLVSQMAGKVRRQLREASAQSSWRSQSADPFLYGVPPGERVLYALVRWPDGTVQKVRRPRPGANAVRQGR